MENKKVAFITGITGQDGSYLAELLLSKGYEVHGLIRRSSSMCNRKWIDGLDIELHYGDITDANVINSLFNRLAPDEVYNLAAQSHVGISFENPGYTFHVNTIGTLNLLEAIRNYDFHPPIRMYQASTSEMLASPFIQQAYDDGRMINNSSNERSHFRVHSPYACSKLAAHELCKIYREAYGMFVSCGILFNHESERRGENFVTQKIVKNLVKKQSFELGNIEAHRDWGHAKDYVEAMYLMLQQDKPDDFIIATNESHSVREFIEECCFQLSYDLRILNKGMFEIVDKRYSGDYFHVTHSVTEKRPWDVQYLRGDYSKAKRVLGWTPKVTFKELIKIMIEEELKKYDERN